MRLPLWGAPATRHPAVLAHTPSSPQPTSPQDFNVYGQMDAVLTTVFFGSSSSSDTEYCEAGQHPALYCRQLHRHMPARAPTL